MYCLKFAKKQLKMQDVFVFQDGDQLRQWSTMRELNIL